VAGKQGRELGTTYCATKFAIRSLTQTSGKYYSIHSDRTISVDSFVALELGKYGITVNAYAPGEY